MAGAVTPRPCPWCNTIHVGPYVLCDEHEQLARTMITKRGGTIRE